MTKRIISALLCLCMLISAGPVGFAETAEQIVEPEETEEENLFSAEENLNSGTCGDGLTWALDAEGILRISGLGAMEDYDSGADRAPWYGLREDILSVYLDQGVTSIGDYGFYGLDKLDSVVIGDDVARIGSCGFSGCSALSYVQLPESITEIGMAAFENCASLVEMQIPEKVRRIESRTFYGCEALDSMALPRELQGIGDSSFEGCASLGAIAIPQGVDRIENYTFQNCANLRMIQLPEKLTSIGSAAFAHCGALKEVELPDGLDSIGSSTFQDCQSLERMVIPEKICVIPEALFSGCENLSEVAIPETVTAIGNYAFYGCASLTAKLPRDLQSIGRYAFSGCEDSDLFDLSHVPTTIQENIALAGLVEIPERLSDWTGGGAAISWSVETVSGEGQAAKVEGDTLLRIHPGRFRLVCTDAYTGIRSSKLMEVTSNLEIRPEGPITITSGQSIQLSAVAMPGEEPVFASWSLEAGGEKAASISTDGLLTAKSVAKKTEIRAIAVTSSGDTARRTVTILPRVTGISVLIDGKTAPDKLYVDMKQTQTLSLSAVVWPEEARTAVEWASGQDHIASVDQEGTVTLLSPGRTMIYARSTDGSGIWGELLLVVQYVDKAETLTLRASKTVLEAGEQVQLVLSGEEDIPAESVSFSVLEDGGGSVDENGVFTAGDLLGYVNVTAMITGDSQMRKASLRLRIKEELAHELRLTPEFPDDQGAAADTELYVDTSRLGGKAYSFRLRAQGLGASGVWKDTENVTFASTNTSLATVSADGTVTVKAKAEGSCEIVSRSQDALEVETGLRLIVQDRSPRLESRKLTLNSYRWGGVSTALVESYGNAIQSVTVYDYDKAAKAYQETPSKEFSASWEAETLTLETWETLSGGTYPLKLTAVCDSGAYDYLIQVKVANALPKITVKQERKFNLFYLDSRAPFTVTANGAEIENMELAGTEDFRLEYGRGEAWVTYGEGFASGKDKPVTKGKLLINLEGYRKPVEQNFTLATVNTAPKLTVNPAASVINTALNSQLRESWTRIYQNGEPLDLSEAEIRALGDFVQLESRGEDLIFRLTGETGGTVSFLLQLPNWAREIKLSHKITLETKLPKLTLANGTLKLSSVFPGQAAETELRLSQCNLDLGPVSFVSTAKAGSAAEKEADKLALSFDPEGRKISTEIKKGEEPKAGTYGFSVRTSLADDGTELSPVTLKVTVSAGVPKVSLSAKGKLDTLKPGSSIAYTVTKLTNCPGPVEAMALEGMDADRFQAELDTTGTKTVVNLKLLPGESYDTRTTYKVRFRFTVWDVEILSPVLNVRVSQSALKVTLPKTVNYYRGQSGPIQIMLRPSAELAEITLGSKTDKNFLQALGDEAHMTVEENQILFRLENPGALKVGKSYVVCLNVTPEGNAVNAKPTQVKLTVRVVK